MFRKKGQAAMEFLMTYGWAILVVLVAIGALAYFGVLSPDKFLPERCTGPAGLDCIDKASVTLGAAGANRLTFVIKNNLGFNIAFNETATYASSVSNGDCAGISANFPTINTVDIDVGGGNLDAPINNAAQATVVIACTNEVFSGRFKTDVGIPYKNLNSGLYHTATFGITGVAS